MGVNVERHGVAAVITLDWPSQRNALGIEEAQELTKALGEATRASDVCGIVLTGNGAFSAGVNLKGLISRAGMPPEERAKLVYGVFQATIRAIIDTPVPVFAAIDGPAIGLGFDLALACDARIIGPNGWCMQGWGRLAAIPATGGEWLLRQRAPSLLWRLLEDQPRIDGAMAERYNIGEATGGETARERTIARVNKLGEMSRIALESYVALYRFDLRNGLDAHLAEARAQQIKLLGRPELTERAKGLLKKPG